MKLQALTICKTSRKAKTKFLHTTSLDFLFAVAAIAAPVPLAAAPRPLTAEPAHLPAATVPRLAAPGPWPAPWAPPVTSLAVGALGADLASGMKGVRPPEEEGAEAMAPWIPCEIE